MDLVYLIFEQIEQGMGSTVVADWKVVYEPRDMLRRMSAQILEFATIMDATYLVVGKDGDSAVERALSMHVGTVTDQISNKGRMTTVVVG